MAARKEIIEIAGFDVTITNPEKIYFPRTGHTKLDLVRYYLAVAGGALTAVGDRPMALEAVRQRHREGGVLPEAGAGEAARVDRDGRVDVPVRPVGARDRRARRRAAGVGGEPRLRRPAPARRARRRRAPPGRTAGRPRPGARRRVGAGARGGSGGPRGAGRPRPGGLAQDHRVARLPRLQPHRSAVDIPAGAPGRRRAGPRDRRARAAHRHQSLVEGGAARRVRRLQPERQGPHDGGRVLGAAHPRRAGVGAAALGRGTRLRPGRLHHRHHAGPLRGDRRPVDRHRRRRRLARTAAGTGRPAEDRGPERIRRGGRAGGAGQGERGVRTAPHLRPADRDQPGEVARGGDGRPRTLEGPPSRGLGTASSPPTCWSTRCGDAAPRGTACGSTCGTSPRTSAPHRRRWRSTTTRSKAGRDPAVRRPSACRPSARARAGCPP